MKKQAPKKKARFKTCKQCATPAACHAMGQCALKSGRG